jgi:hypothetical protein
MSQPTPDPAPAAEVTVNVPGMDARTVSLDPTQVFVYAPAVTDTNDPRLRRMLERVAWQLRRSQNAPGVVGGPPAQPSDAVVLLPAEGPGAAPAQ